MKATSTGVSAQATIVTHTQHVSSPAQVASPFMTASCDRGRRCRVDCVREAASRQQRQADFVSRYQVTHLACAVLAGGVACNCCFLQKGAGLCAGMRFGGIAKASRQQRRAHPPQRKQVTYIARVCSGAHGIPVHDCLLHEEARAYGGYAQVSHASNKMTCTARTTQGAGLT
jgi:hypothetical protein